MSQPFTYQSRKIVSYLRSFQLLPTCAGKKFFCHYLCQNTYSCLVSGTLSEARKRKGLVVQEIRPHHLHPTLQRALVSWSPCLKEISSFGGFFPLKKIIFISHFWAKALCLDSNPYFNHLIPKTTPVFQELKAGEVLKHIMFSKRISL